MDGAGRLVVPKAVRTRLRLGKGTRLRIREEGARLVLEPLDDDGAIADVDGLLLVRGRLLGEVPDHRRLREERIRELGRAQR